MSEQLNQPERQPKIQFYITCGECEQRTFVTPENTIVSMYTCQPWFNNAQTYCETDECGSVSCLFFDKIRPQAKQQLDSMASFAPPEDYCDDEAVVEYRREVLEIEELEQNPLSHKQEHYAANWGKFLEGIIVTVEDF